METIKLTAQVGADGMLNLQVPVSMTNAELEVIMVVQAVSTPKPKLKAKSVKIDQIDRNAKATDEEVQASLLVLKEMEVLGERISKHWQGEPDAVAAVNEGRGRLD
jgi:hypothetical protein